MKNAFDKFISGLDRARARGKISMLEGRSTEIQREIKAEKGHTYRNWRTPLHF
jgi:hypothetical protein